MKSIAIIPALLMLSACDTAPLAEYQPVIDRPGKHYQTDLAECRVLAQQAEAKYTKQQQDAMMANILVGAIAGGIIGSAYGGNNAGAGAAYGIAAGAASTDTEQAYGGPRRIIDRCLAGRGYRVISDLGAG